MPPKEHEQFNPFTGFIHGLCNPRSNINIQHLLDINRKTNLNLFNLTSFVCGTQKALNDQKSRKRLQEDLEINIEHVITDEIINDINKKYNYFFCKELGSITSKTAIFSMFLGSITYAVNYKHAPKQLNRIILPLKLLNLANTLGGLTLLASQYETIKTSGELSKPLIKTLECFGREEIDESIRKSLYDQATSSLFE